MNSNAAPTIPYQCRAQYGVKGNILVLKADFTRIRQLADTVDDLATYIEAVDIGSPTDMLSAALPGCPVPAACGQVGAHLEDVWLRAARRTRQVATIIVRHADQTEKAHQKFVMDRDALLQRSPGAK